ncbi:MAG: class I SAM-dependent methyltransferase [Leptospiraceae bacterium]|nr:class I SAM-dependent methyltransferase [Leptospiraceae bacterium]
MKEIIIKPRAEFSLNAKHPWIYSGAIVGQKGVRSGDLVQIKNKKKEILGEGIFANRELIGTRVFSFGKETFLANYKESLKQAFLKRKALIPITNSFRIIHGEADGFPGITIDYNAGHLRIQYYSKSLYKIARLISFQLPKHCKNLSLNLSSISLVVPRRNSGNMQRNSRILKGNSEDIVEIFYRSIRYKISPELQKSGIYNDVRNLRSFILDHPELIKGKKVLNLFSNNGLLSKCFEVSQAKTVLSLEDSLECIKVHESNLNQSSIQKVQRLDIFQNLEIFLQDKKENFGVIVIDPPSLTSKESDKDKARKIYQSLFRTSIPYLVKNGILILASCSNRIFSEDFERIAREVFKEKQMQFKLITKLKEELDHPQIESFPEGNYLKVHIYTRVS